MRIAALQYANGQVKECDELIHRERCVKKAWYARIPCFFYVE